MKNWKTLLVCLLICLLPGMLGSLATAPAIPAWYAGLEKPSFNPPNWIFGPVWTTLYLMMGFSLWLAWNAKGKARKAALVAFGIQLALNAAWSPAFFGLNSPALGLAVILSLWLAIVATLFLMYRLRPLASYLLVPYLLWVSFASVLNFALWKMN